MIALLKFTLRKVWDIIVNHGTLSNISEIKSLHVRIYKYCGIPEERKTFEISF